MGISFIRNFNRKICNLIRKGIIGIIIWGLFWGKVLKLIWGEILKGYLFFVYTVNNDRIIFLYYD